MNWSLSCYCECWTDETKETSGGPSAETARTTPDRGMVQEIASHPRRFSFNELRLATRNFRREDFLGMGGFGPVYKGWINENPVKPGTGLAVAVKILNRYGVQGHREWLVCCYLLSTNYLHLLFQSSILQVVLYITGWSSLSSKSPPSKFSEASWLLHGRTSEANSLRVYGSWESGESSLQ